MKYLLLIFLTIPIIGVSQSYIGYTHKVVNNVVYLDSGAIPKTFAKSDTIPSSILISHKAPSFGHSIDGYCIYKYGQCTGKHLKVWRKKLIVIPPQYIIWKCIRRDKP